MDSKDPHNRPYLSILQPQLIVWVLLAYSIGVGLVHQQGGDLNWLNILLGSLLGVFLLSARNFLQAYFNHPDLPVNRQRHEDGRYPELNGMPRQTLLVVSLVLLTAGALDSILLFLHGPINPSFLLILALAFLLAFFSALPPIQLQKNGYGELGEAILITNLIPALGYLVNKPDLHILLLMLTLPLTLLYLALKIVQSLERYAFDRSHGIHSLVTRLEWNRAMPFHNILVLMAFLFVGIFAVLGQPWSLTWPMFLPLVIGIFQIVQVQSIYNGVPPRWKPLKLTAYGSFVVMAYLVSFTLWIT